MATDPKVLHGARIVVSIGPNIIGTVNSVQWQLMNDTADIFIMGRLHAAEIVYTAQEPISGTLGGWRVVDHGAYAEIGLPPLNQLLTADYTTLTLVDRVTRKIVGNIQQVRLLGTSGGGSARSPSEYNIPFKAILFSDETVTNNDERSDRTALP